MPKEKPLEKESLIIKFEHLNPRLQEIIGKRIRGRYFITWPCRLGAEIADLSLTPFFRKNSDKLTATPQPNTIRELRALRTIL